MTKEKLIEKCFHICDNKKISSDAEYLASTMRKFFESNIYIPKGENRHPCADVLHEWIEGAACESDGITYKSRILESADIIFDDIEYRIKPSEPIYEWRYAHDNGHGKAIVSDRYYTDEEYEKYVDDKECTIKLPWTKRGANDK